jgi:hypothetical protein
LGFREKGNHVPLSHTRKTSELDPKGIEVKFSPEVRSGFANLAAAVHFSNHFDEDMRGILEHWATGTRQTVHDLFISFPLIAQETFKHIHATGDKRAAKAWREIGSEMLERGFSLERSRDRGK